MTWKLKYLPEAIDDLNKIDNSVKPQIIKGIKKVLENPISKNEGGYGTPLGNKNNTNLTGLYKIKFRGIGQRVVYLLERNEKTMTVIIVSVREDGKVYKETEKRRNNRK